MFRGFNARHKNRNEFVHFPKDWLDSRGEADRATAVVGLARMFSKLTSAASAMGGGLILYLSFKYNFGPGYGLLFYLSAAAAIAGFVLMLTYPKELEGEQRRQASGEDPASKPGFKRRLALLARGPGILALFGQSVLFESQVKLLLKYYIQPFIGDGLKVHGILIKGKGALWVGANELVRDGLGGLGARLSHTFERRAGGTHSALRIVYLLVILAAAVAALCVGRIGDHLAWVVAGLIALVAITVLQNARRPIFVSAFNRVMDKPQRATTLSIESQSRSFLAGVLLPLTGWVADSWGLEWVFVIICGILVAGLAFRVRKNPGNRNGIRHAG